MDRLRGWTVMELLVSIAVIAILIGIALPVYSLAIESARRVDCRINLRTLHQATQMYRDDHGGAMPYADQGIFVRYDLVAPADALAPYLGGVAPRLNADGEVTTSAPYMCRSDRERWMRDGTSYVYTPHVFLAISGVSSVTQMYEREPGITMWADWHMMGHGGRAQGVSADGRVGWRDELGPAWLRPVERAEGE